MKNGSLVLRVFLLVFSLIFSLVFLQSVYAGPADYIFTPGVKSGERELSVQYGKSAPIAGKSAQVASIGLGYGMSESWFSEVYLKQARNGAQNSTLVEWENKFQLTETGQYPVDIGLITELEIPVSGNVPWELRFGPLLQKDIGKLQLNANMLFERAFGKADEDGVPFSTNIAYQWQVKYRWQEELEFGMQGMGELGTWNKWSPQAEQNHRIGPVVSGELELGNHQAIKYNLAWLAGVSAAAPNHTVRMSVEYEF